MAESKLDQILDSLIEELQARKAPSVFRPVKTTEKAISQRDPIEGFVYFTTDSKKIYLGSNEEYVSMGGNSGIYYGIKEIPKDNSGVEPDPNVMFIYPDEFDANTDTIPMTDDLILNIDGCFYRVLSANSNPDNDVYTNIYTKRLTLQGGGGSTDGGEGTVNYSLQTINVNNVFSSAATEMKLYFKANYISTTIENAITRISLRLASQGEFFYNKVVNIPMPFTEPYGIDIIEYKHLFNENYASVILETEDMYGTKRSTEINPWRVSIVNLEINSKEPKLFYSNSNEYSYSYTISGAASGVSNKRIVFSYYIDNNSEPIYTEEVSLLSETQSGTKRLNLTSLEHGVYTLKVQAFADIANNEIPLPSNILTHKIGKFSNINNPLLLVDIADEAEQHTNITASYLLVTNNIGKEYVLEIKIDQDEPIKLSTISNSLDTYDFYFERIGNYPLRFYVPEIGSEFTTNIKIIRYTGNLPVIDATRDELMLYLNPKGKSNNALDKDLWQDYNGRYTAKITNGTYTDKAGWLKDAVGTSYLQLSSGASLEVLNFYPFQNDPARNDGMTIELDFEVAGVLDFDSEIIKCISISNQGAIQCGFSITGDKIYFYNSRLNGGELGPLASTNIVENKRIRLSFVIEPNSIEFPMCYTYLNGKISGAVIYDTDDRFQQADNPAIFKISAEKAQVKIYSVRFYNTNLSDSEILNNYTASLPTLEEREKQYNSNNVFTQGKIDFNKVSWEGYDLQVPYMKITGGYATEKKSKWQLQGQTTANYGLPTGKKDYRLIDVEVKYPKNNNYFKGYQDYKFVNEFASGEPMATAYGEEPSNGGCIMYAQGTSSMEYPVKNLRLRFKNNEDFYIVRPDIAPVEIICMKADYMESSGSHNTGSANLIDDLYRGMGIKTPAQKHFQDNENDKTIVTCIKGHPCLIFYSPDGSNYEYIGKYNLNLDKATPQPFGFDHDDESSFGYLNAGEKYWEIKYDKDENIFVGQLDPSESGDYVSDQEEVEKIVESPRTVNSIHCFEFLDNAVPVCNFKCRPKKYIENENGEMVPDPVEGYYSYDETWHNSFWNAKEKKYMPGWAFGFESRYPEDRVGYHDAESLYPLAEWLNTLQTLREAEEAAGKSPTDITYTYNYTVATEYKDFTAYYILVGNEYQPAWPTAETFGDNTYYTRTVRDSRFAMDSLERFKREYQCYLNKEFLIAYYLITEALLMADSRVKNMMIATWGKEVRSYVDLNGETHSTNNYIFYPIFYDMDTMLGLDNTGVYKFNYYDEDTISTLFNGDEVLWFFVRDALKDELPAGYNALEGAYLTANKILPYFNLNQANMANEAFYNGDSQYKYIGYARTGYKDDSSEEDKYIEPGAAPFLYALQGDRSLMREWFVTNRIKFLRGKYNSNNYQNGDRVEFRWYYPKGSTGDAGLDLSAQYVPPTNFFNFTSLKTGYAGVKLGANGNSYNERFNGEETKTIVLPEASGANGTEAYLLGLSNLTDLGDLSSKYMQKFIISSTDVRLQHLTLGNPHRCYKNPYWKPTGGQSQAIGLTGCTYLKTFNLQNCIDYNNTLNFSGSPAIEKILLTGSSVSGLTLPENGNLKELRLPSTIRNLKIHSHANLTNENFSLGDYDYGTDNLDVKIEEYNIAVVTEDTFVPNQYYIFDEDSNEYIITTEYDSSAIYYEKLGKYTNDFSGITVLSIIDTPIDTYEILRQAEGLQEYCLLGVDWKINADDNDVRYCIRLKTNEVEESLANGSVQYYYFNITTQTYEPYTRNTYPSEGSLYEKIEMLTDNAITSIPMLDYLMVKRPTTQNGNPANHLSGTITIYSKNGGISVEEIDIYKKYNTIYPNITIKYGEGINVAEAYVLNFYNLETITEETSPYFTVKGTARNSIKELIDGSYTPTALAEPIATISKPDTAYVFSGMWYDRQRNISYSHQDLQTDTTIKLTSNLDLVPTYKRVPKYYNVEFFDDSGTLYLNDQLTYNTNIKAGLQSRVTYQLTEDTERIASKAYFTWIEDSAKFALYNDDDFINKSVYEEIAREPNYILDYIYKDNTELQVDGFLRWDLEGWISQRDYLEETEKPEFYNLSATNIKDHFRAYARMKAVDIKATPMSLELFEFTAVTDPVSSNSLYAIKLKDIYRNIVQGEFTLPLVDSKNRQILAIADNGLLAPNITELHFKDDGVNGSYKYIGSNAMGDLSDSSNFAINTIVFPDTLEKIGRYAFYNLDKLVHINLPESITHIYDSAFGATFKEMHLQLTELPPNLVWLGAGAFTNNKDITINSLPSGLRTIESNVFAWCDRVVISEFGSDDGEGLESIGISAFLNAGIAAPKPQFVTFNESVYSIVNSPDMNGINSSFAGSYLGKASIITFKNDHIHTIVGDTLYGLIDDDDNPPQIELI